MKWYAYLFVMLVLVIGCSRTTPPSTSTSPAGTPTGPVTTQSTPTPNQSPDPAPSAAPPPVPEKPASIIWAQGLGSDGPEELYRFEGIREFLALSPDGQYLFSASSADDFGRYTPHVLDRKSGKERIGDSSILLRPAVTWSGQGFWIAPLTHVGLDATLSTNEQVGSSLESKGWELVNAEFSPNGAYVAAVLHAVDGGTQQPQTLDFVLAKPSGEVVHRESKAISATYLKRGYKVDLVWSPDCSLLVVCGVECQMVNPQQPAREAWTRLPDLVSGQPPRWSPDGKNLLYPGYGIVGTDGRLKLAISMMDVAWNATGTAVLILGQELIVQALDGGRTVQHKATPPRIIGWLPDGRMVSVTYPGFGQ